MESEEPDGVQAPEKGILTHDLRRSHVDTSNTYVREFMPRLQSTPGPQPKHAKHGPPLHGARGASSRLPEDSGAAKLRPERPGPFSLHRISHFCGPWVSGPLRSQEMLHLAFGR